MKNGIDSDCTQIPQRITLTHFTARKYPSCRASSHLYLSDFGHRRWGGRPHRHTPKSGLTRARFDAFLKAGAYVRLLLLAMSSCPNRSIDLFFLFFFLPQTICCSSLVPSKGEHWQAIHLVLTFGAEACWSLLKHIRATHSSRWRAIWAPRLTAG